MKLCRVQYLDGKEQGWFHRWITPENGGDCWAIIEDEHHRVIMRPRDDVTFMSFPLRDNLRKCMFQIWIPHVKDKPDKDFFTNGVRVMKNLTKASVTSPLQL